MVGRGRYGFTLVELLVVMTVVSTLIGLLFPAVQAAREAARRISCASNVKQITLALHHYADARRVLPPGAVLERGRPDYDIRHNTENGPQGTSWMLSILPYIEQNVLFDQWDFGKNLEGNHQVGSTDIAMFYCPSRRDGLRDRDEEMMFLDWAGGGTDYGGCLGRCNGFSNACNIDQWCGHRLFRDEYLEGRGKNLAGALGPNSTTRFRDITDGTSQTILVGEVQRLVPGAGLTGLEKTGMLSDDGWAVAGVATLFVTAVAGEGYDRGQPGGLNNEFFECAGSEHPDGAHFGMADGSVRFLNDEIDPQVYAWMGSIADGEVFEMPD